MDTAADHPIYEFEGFRLDTRSRELTNLGRGQTVALKPRQYEALRYFVANPGRLIGKAVLMAALWPDTVVEENNLNQHITALRQLLGEDRSGRRFIMNVRGQGWQFVPDVMQLERGAPAMSSASSPPPSANLAAWQCFQQALFLTGTDDPAQWAVAMERLAHAVQLDPGFASALALLAQHRVRLVTLDWQGSRDLLDRAEQEAARAFQLRPDLAFVQMAAGSVAAARGNWVQAEQCFRVAATLDEEWPIVHATHVAHVLLSTGHVRRAVSLVRAPPARAHGMIGIVLIEAMTHLIAGNEAEAREAAMLIRVLGGRERQPHLADCFALLALREGRHDEAIRLLQANLSAPMRAAGAEEVVRRVVAALVAPDGRTQAVGTMDRMLEGLPIGAMTDTMRLQLLVWYAQLGNLDRAYAFGYAMLDHYAGQGSAGIFWGHLWRSEMRLFRDDPRFAAFTARIGLTEYWRQYGPPCADGRHAAGVNRESP